MQSDVYSGMSLVTQQLIALSNKTFFINSAVGRTVAQALNQMDASLKAMEERNTPIANGKQQQAMESVNQTIQLLLKSTDQMQNGQSGTGMQQLMEELKQMAGKQGGINQGTMPFQNPGSLSPEQQAALGRMMAEQQALRQSLEGLQERASAEQNLRGQLGNMAKEMDDVIRDMQNNNVNRKTIERQQKILQRLLDASKSMNERDYDEKRKAESGKDYRGRSPGELPENLTERRNRIREELMKELNQGYSKDYQELIKKYFDALGNLQNEKSPSP